MPTYRSDPPGWREVLAACDRMEAAADCAGPSHAVTVARLAWYVGDTWDRIAAMTGRDVRAERAAMVAECDGYLPGRARPATAIAPRLAEAYREALPGRLVDRL